MKYNLLFVDDDQWIAESMRDILNWEDFSINSPYIAYGMEQAQEIFEKVPVHIIISDIEMLGYNGFELLEWVHNTYPKTLTAFLSCHARFDFAQKAIRLGIFGYLLKPVREQELAELLRSCVQELEKRRVIDPGNTKCEFPAGESSGSNSTDTTHVYPERIQKVIQYIQENLANQISRETICQELFISESYLSRTFTKEVGMTLIDYITECRISRAKELLRTTDESVTNICMQVGYNYAAYFTKIFKEKTGVTPNQYRDALKDS